MNSRERVALTMRHIEPDRVPVMCQLSLGHYLLNTGISPHELWFTSEGLAEAMVSLQRRYRFDGILVNVPGRPDGFLEDVTKIENASDGEWLTWRNGDRTFLPWDDMAHHYPADSTQPDRMDFSSADPDHLDNIDDYPGYLWNVFHIQTIP